MMDRPTDSNAPTLGEALAEADVPTRRPLDEGEPCPECGYAFDSDEWDVRHLSHGPSVGETWIYTCPDCEQETAEVGI